MAAGNTTKQAVRPKKLYRSVEAAKAADVAADRAKVKAGEVVSRKNLPKNSAAATSVPLDKLSRKELQAKAVACGLKANAKSADLVKQLEKLQEAATAGATIGSELISNPTGSSVPAPFRKSGEAKELDELDFLGIKGRTPGGTKWRTKVHGYNLRSTTATGAE